MATSLVILTGWGSVDKRTHLRHSYDPHPCHGRLDLRSGKEPSEYLQGKTLILGLNNLAAQLNMRKSAIRIGGGRLSYEPSRYYRRLEGQIQNGTKRQTTNARSKIEQQYRLWNRNKSCPIDDSVIEKAWSQKVHGKLSHEMWLKLLEDN